MDRKNVDWLLVGTGDIARKRVGNALKADGRSTLYAVCDSDSRQAQDFAADFGVSTVYGSLQEALEDEKVNAVYIATPVFLHKEMSIEALEAGKHVLVEKPMALTYRDAQEMVEKAGQYGKKLGAAYFRRMFNKYDHLNRMLEKDEFGKIVLIRLTYFSWHNPQPDDPKYWRVIKDKGGGGAIYDMGSHMFDLMIGLFDVPASVYAKVETNIFDYEVEDSAVITMKCRNGAQVAATFHWCSKTWSHEFEVIGTEAKVKWHPFDSPKYLKTVGRDIREITSETNANVHVPLISEFSRWVLEGGDFVCRGEEAMKTNRLIDAVYESASRNEEVVL